MILPVCEDLVDLFLREAERCGMDFYFGTCDSGRHWVFDDHAKDRSSLTATGGTPVSTRDDRVIRMGRG